MGWLFSPAWPNASSMRDHLRDSLKEAGWTIKGDALTNYGRHYYATVVKDGEPAGIFVALLEGRKDDGWGYKDMSESMHPYIYDCPLRLLALADPTDHESALEWRDGVRAYHARRKAGAAAVKVAKKGDKVWANGREEPYTVAYRRKNTLIAYRADGDGPYRIPTTRITRFEPVGGLS